MKAVTPKSASSILKRSWIKGTTMTVITKAMRGIPMPFRPAALTAGIALLLSSVTPSIAQTSSLTQGADQAVRDGGVSSSVRLSPSRRGTAANENLRFVDAARAFQNCSSGTLSDQNVSCKIETGFNNANAGRISLGRSELNEGLADARQIGNGRLYAKALNYLAATYVMEGVDRDSASWVASIQEKLSEARSVRNSLRGQVINGSCSAEFSVVGRVVAERPGVITEAASPDFSFDTGPRLSVGQALAVQDAQSYYFEGLMYDQVGNHAQAKESYQRAKQALENGIGAGRCVPSESPLRDELEPRPVGSAFAPFLTTMIEVSLRKTEFNLPDRSPSERLMTTNALDSFINESAVAQSYPGHRKTGLALLELAAQRIELGQFLACSGGCEGRSGKQAFEEGASLISSRLEQPTVDLAFVQPVLDAIYDTRNQNSDWKTDFYDAIQIVHRPEVAETAAQALVSIKEGTEVGDELRALEALERAYRSDYAQAAKLRADLELSNTPEQDLVQIASLQASGLRGQEIYESRKARFDRSDAGQRLAQLQSDGVDLNELQGVLGPDEAYVRFVIGEPNGYSVVLRRDDLFVHRFDNSNNRIDDFAQVLRCGVTFHQDYSTSEAIRLRDSCNTVLREPSVSGVAMRSEFDRVFPFYDVKIAAELFESLFGPMAASIRNEELGHLIIQAEGDLAAIPFSALVVRDSDQQIDGLFTHRTERRSDDTSEFGGIFRGSDYSNVPWLMSKTDLSVSVGEAAFVQSRSTEQAVSRPAKPFLGMGGFLEYEQNATLQLAKANSALRGRQDISGGLEALGSQRLTQGITVDRCLNFYKSVPGLDRTVEQAETVQKAIGGDLVLVREFTDANLRSETITTSDNKQVELSDYKVLMFATHGLSPVSELENTCFSEPGLTTNIFSPSDGDGYLSASEIAKLEMRAELVILSACQTAVGAVVSAFSDKPAQSAETFDGLVRSLFYARAQSVLATYWNIGVDDTTLFLEQFFAGASVDGLQSASLAGRLGEAQAAIQERSISWSQSSDAKLSTSHPYFWAPYVFVGDGRRALEL